MVWGVGAEIATRYPMLNTESKGGNNGLVRSGNTANEISSATAPNQSAGDFQACSNVALCVEPQKARKHLELTGQGQTG